MDLLAAAASRGFGAQNAIGAERARTLTVSPSRRQLLLYRARRRTWRLSRRLSPSASWQLRTYLETRNPRTATVPHAQQPPHARVTRHAPAVASASSGLLVQLGALRARLSGGGE
jgi:hypothetical protein